VPSGQTLMTDEQFSNLELGLSYMGTDEYKQAIYHLTLAIEEGLDDEDEIEAYRSRSLAYGQSGMVAEALADADWYIARGKTDRFRWRGHLKERLQDYAGALEDYSKVIELEAPPNFEIYLKRGQMYFHTGQFKQAIEDFTTALSLESRTTIGEAIYVWRGKAYVDDGQYQAGLDDFQRAIDIVGFEPHDVFWYCFHRGLAKEALGDSDGALKDFRRATIPDKHPQVDRVKKLLQDNTKS